MIIYYNALPNKKKKNRIEKHNQRKKHNVLILLKERVVGGSVYSSLENIYYVPVEVCFITR